MSSKSKKKIQFEDYLSAASWEQTCQEFMHFSETKVKLNLHRGSCLEIPVKSAMEAQKMIGSVFRNIKVTVTLEEI